jgi:elongation factor P
VYDTSDIKKNLKIKMEGVPFTVVDFQFVKPGKGNAFTRTKLRNMFTGAVIERTFRSNETSCSCPRSSWARTAGT